MLYIAVRFCTKMYVVCSWIKSDEYMSNFGVRCSMFGDTMREGDVRCSMFGSDPIYVSDVRCPEIVGLKRVGVRFRFDVRCSMFDVRCSMFDVRCLIFDVTLDISDQLCTFMRSHVHASRNE